MASSEAILMTPVSPPRINQIAILRRRAHTAPTVAAHGGATALRLALVVNKRQQMIIVNRHRRVRHVRHPRAKSLRIRRQIRRHVHAIIAANRRRREAIGQIVHERFSADTAHRESIRKALTRPLGPVRHAQQHRHIRQKQKHQHADQIHSTRRHLSIMCSQIP